MTSSWARLRSKSENSLERQGLSPYKLFKIVVGESERKRYILQRRGVGSIKSVNVTSNSRPTIVTQEGSIWPKRYVAFKTRSGLVKMTSLAKCSITVTQWLTRQISSPTWSRWFGLEKTPLATSELPQIIFFPFCIHRFVSHKSSTSLKFFTVSSTFLNFAPEEQLCQLIGLGRSGPHAKKGKKWDLCVLTFPDGQQQHCCQWKGEGDLKASQELRKQRRRWPWQWNMW